MDMNTLNKSGNSDTQVTPNVSDTPSVPNMQSEKFCKCCGGKINANAVICPLCGCQVEQIAQANTQPMPNIVINNANHNSATANAGGVTMGKPKNKWVSLLLCIFTFCGHKFYEGKAGMGVLYLLTGGLFGIGWIIDIFAILAKPNPYYV